LEDKKEIVRGQPLVLRNSKRIKAEWLLTKEEKEMRKKQSDYLNYYDGRYYYLLVDVSLIGYCWDGGGIIVLPSYCWLVSVILTKDFLNRCSIYSHMGEIIISF
jgi:hypothetical protein